MDQTEDNRSKLQYAFRVIQETFEKQTSAAQEESSKWKTQCILQKKQIGQLEEDLKQAQARVHQLERLVKEANESRNIVFRKFNALKKKHDQLSKFKNSIEHMLHGDVPFQGNDDSALDNLDEDLNTSLDLDNFNKGAATKSFELTGDYNATTNSTYNNVLGKDFMTSPQSPQFSSSFNTPSISNNDGNEVEVEAKTLYAQVKQSLSAQQFKQFANNIRQLNGGHQSVEETLQNIKEIFGPERTNLYNELQKLVKSSAQE